MCARRAVLRSRGRVALPPPLPPITAGSAWATPRTIPTLNSTSPVAATPAEPRPVPPARAAAPASRCPREDEQDDRGQRVAQALQGEQRRVDDRCRDCHRASDAAHCGGGKHGPGAEERHGDTVRHTWPVSQDQVRAANMDQDAFGADFLQLIRQMRPRTAWRAGSLPRAPRLAMGGFPREHDCRHPRPCRSAGGVARGWSSRRASGWATRGCSRGRRGGGGPSSPQHRHRRLSPSRRRHRRPHSTCAPACRISRPSRGRPG